MSTTYKPWILKAIAIQIAKDNNWPREDDQPGETNAETLARIIAADHDDAGFTVSRSNGRGGLVITTGIHLDAADRAAVLATIPTLSTEEIIA